MNHSFNLNAVRPNLPLRKPSSSPMTSPNSLPPQRLRGPGAASPVRPASSTGGDGPVLSPFSGNLSEMIGCSPPELTMHFCNFCGQQGNFRCKRCKMAAYCSVLCQTEDWKAHRHLCKAVDPQPAKESPKDATDLPLPKDQTQFELKVAETPNLQRVYLKDLTVGKITGAAEFQASVLEFYSPARFYVLVQSPERLEALQVISTELQKAYSPSETSYVPCIGEVCGVQFSVDMHWYRGLVQTLSADRKEAKVLYIDFGNEEDVPVERIKPMSANIQPFCQCVSAMECRVARVVPLASSWSAECCLAVRQLVTGKMVTVKLLETLDNSQIHAVEILLSMGKKMSTFLIEHGYAAEEASALDVKPTQQEINAMTSVSLENFKRCSNGKDDNSWARPPEPLAQAVGDSYSAMVTHFKSPDEIVVQKVEQAGVIRELLLNLREHCGQVPAPLYFRPAPGTVCCAQFSEDKQWYRAKVLAYPSEERVCVGYLDFGNSEMVELEHLRPINASLLAVPMQAICCGLAGVQPVGGKWPENATLALRNRISNRILRLEIKGAYDGKALVVMKDEGSDPQANIAELLVSAGYAAPASDTASTEQQVDQTCSPAQPQVTASSSEPLVWSFTEIPCDGQTVALQTSVVANPGEFYCRIDNPADHRKLRDLEAELKLHCEADNSPFEPKVGEPCCAMCPGGGTCGASWYRAIIKELCDNQVSVNIVDYGHTIKIERSHLRSIKSKHLTLPFQAIRCWLSGVEPLGSEWSSEALLWFQTLVDGKQLSARFLSVSEQGYGVELESQGNSVAAALVTEQLAKVPGEISTAIRGSAATHQGITKENEHSQTQPSASNQTRVSTQELPNEAQATVPSEAPSFPVDWKTKELPLNETFTPCVAAVINPSLFYLIGDSRVDQQKLLLLMVEIADYCSKNQDSLSSAALSRPMPGAACCAQFSADNSWYRAVILEVYENEMNVLYADFGNTEKVPFSRVLPISQHLLELPFQITRCALAGKEHFPVEWPEEVKILFQTLLLNSDKATVQCFDESANVLSLTLPTTVGGGQVSAFIADALHTHNERNACPNTTQTAGQSDKSSATASIPAEPPCPQPRSTPETQTTAALTTATDLTQQTHQQNDNTSAESLVPEDPSQKMYPVELTTETIPQTHGPDVSGCCCCRSLKTKIDRIEELLELVQMQLSLSQSTVQNI